jgi:hypothetical protein
VLIPIVIAAAWLAAAALYALAGAYVGAVASGFAAPVPWILTMRMRRQAAKLAAQKFIAEQAQKGVDPEEAMERVHELAPDGVTIDTDDVPNTSLKVIGVLALGAITAVVHAIVIQ